jgi:molybdopterin/thiamine biosynthesis adenylyltransferase
MGNNEYIPISIDNNEFEDFKSKKNSIFIDAFEYQIKELFFIKNTVFIGKDKEETYKTDKFKKFSEENRNNFKYFYYPWNNHLIKCINKEDYLSLKTNRNQDLITADEQKKLSNYRVAVLGMSVGSNIAFVLTQAGISNEITLADFDELDTTNLNRILAGVHQIGVNKTIIASRRIYEDNPYANVNIFPEGITNENLEELLKNKKIDCIVEEIDDIKIKIVTRQLALKYKIPVVMITDNGDGVVLHVERYDIGYDKIFHKDPSFWDDKIKREITKEIAGNMIMNDFLGGPQNVDPHMLASVGRVFKKELVSWSQLGSAAILGGVVATVAIKRIALGTSKEKDARIFISPEFSREKLW